MSSSGLSPSELITVGNPLIAHRLGRFYNGPIEAQARFAEESRAIGITDVNPLGLIAIVAGFIGVLLIFITIFLVWIRNTFCKSFELYLPPESQKMKQGLGSLCIDIQDESSNLSSPAESLDTIIIIEEVDKKEDYLVKK